jgi:predicted ferric reductase
MNTSGLALVVIMGAMGALYLVMPYKFEVFYYIHIGGFLACIPLSFIHKAPVLGFGIIAWGADMLVRYIISLYSIDAEALYLPGDVVKIQWKKRFDHEPGAYVFIMIQKLSILEYHPFTISSAPGEEYTTVHIRGLGEHKRVIGMR